MFQFPAFAFYPYVFRVKYPYDDHCKSEAGKTKTNPERPTSQLQ